VGFAENPCLGAEFSDSEQSIAVGTDSPLVGSPQPRGVASSQQGVFSLVMIRFRAFVAV
jgi:hypothetical protein